MKLIRKNNKKGFTLVELIVVIAIIGILALILVPALSNYLGRSSQSAVEASAKAVYTEIITEITNTDSDDEFTLDEDKYDGYTVSLKSGEIKVGKNWVLKVENDKNTHAATVDQNGKVTKAAPTPSTGG